MSKVLAVIIAGLFAVGAYAQNPTGQSPEQGKRQSEVAAACRSQEGRQAPRPSQGGWWRQSKVSEGSGG